MGLGSGDALSETKASFEQRPLLSVFSLLPSAMASDDAASQLKASQDFLRWFQSNGGWYHPHLEFLQCE